ncbi:MAG TPA: NADH-quinone oxidoreductase subunit NuoN [Mycobacteriales bacterium]|nr:NADH-quinone oxidoreductase subunit NuoN [Mycobacteriales bacterium]
MSAYAVPAAVLAQVREDIPAPDISYRSLAPVLVVAGVALLGVLIEAFADRDARRSLQVPVALAGLLGSLIFLVRLWPTTRGTGEIVAEGAIALDGPAVFLQGTIVLLAAASMLLLGERGSPGDPDASVDRSLPSEAVPLAMFAVAGMMLMASASNLLVMFIALEVLSLPLYLLCGLARRKRVLSQESAAKYFLLGAYSSAFFLYGLALLYGYAGSVNLSEIAEASGRVDTNQAFLYSGLAMLAVGLLFKVGAVPFHSWTPDVYQGAPTPITALMAAGTKVAAFGALLRVLYVSFGPLQWDWRPAIWVAAILTMVVGAVVAVTQTDVKRMLAYSSVAHAGFILTGVAAANVEGLRGVMFYLVAYGFTVIGSFGVVTLVRDQHGEATHLSQWQGLGKRSPVVAATFATFLFALAGIPLTSGFIAKLTVFEAAVEGRATALVVVGVVTSAVAAFFYARVVVLMFFQEPAPDGPVVVVPSAFTAAALGLSLAVTVLLGLLPGQVLRLADEASLFIR